MPLLLSQPYAMFVPGTTSPPGEVEHTRVPHLAVRSVDNAATQPDLFIPHINLAYGHHDSETSARALIYRIQPRWRDAPQELEFTKFTEGITNTLLRIARRRPGATQEEVDNESILMRAYGNNTDLIIDRDREARSHALLAKRGMAPPLLARFDNGLLYKYIPGKPCTPEDLTREEVWRGVARKLAEWHARVPISAVSSHISQQVNGTNGFTNGHSHNKNGKMRRKLESRSPEPNLWSVLQKWVDVLPTGTDKECAKKDLLQREIERAFDELDTHDGIGEDGFVFGHLDLLSGNVILLPTKPDTRTASSGSLPVTFIDYEYAAPCPAVMDIANHFAEWAGFDLDYNKLPTRAVRREFLKEYLASYNKHSGGPVDEGVLESLEIDIDRWRGIPGLYWGIWALIQATISEIDFDYAQYAEQRLDEYWAWRAESVKRPNMDVKSVPLRERRWAQEV